MGIWYSTDYYSSNLKNFNSYKEKQQFIKNRQNKKLIELIELKEQLINELIKELKENSKSLIEKNFRFRNYTK